jgi:hypothetical protein
MKTQIIILMMTAFVALSCSVVRQGEIGMKRKLGKLDQKILQPGAVGTILWLRVLLKCLFAP